VKELVAKVAPSGHTVLIQGESGVGKELVARSIHQLSPRRDRPYVVVDCGMLNENLLQNELFGHQKGAFTGATALKHGLFEVADTGTLFLDEIGEVSPVLQAKLLRVLETGSFRRLGSTVDLKVDVRLVAATNRDLRGLIAAGLFREDLFYRLNVITVAIPPLRERAEDIPALARHFLAAYGRKRQGAARDFAPAALAALAAYGWPGNVRELENVIERAVILSDGELIGPEDLAVPAPQAAATGGPGGAAAVSLEDVEREHILRVLREAGGNQSRASQILGIDRKTLYLKLRKYGLPEAPG
jgi:DNA-binding NtrC family response regulator